MLASNGLTLPVFNVFRMFSQMGGQRVPAESSGAVSLDAMLKYGVRKTPDVAAFAALEGKQLSVMAWHYHDDDVTGPDAAVSMDLLGLPQEIAAAQLAELEPVREVKVESGRAVLDFQLPRQAVSLLAVEWA